METYPGEPLNILHTIGLKELYPIVRIHFTVDGSFDLTQFKKAVEDCAKVVPQLFCRYRLADNSFVRVTDDLSQIVFENQDADEQIAKWDLFKDPQLRIYLNSSHDSTSATIFLSHILTDGAGAKQFLYLLAQAYNGKLTDVKNHQDINWLKQLIKDHPVKVDPSVDHPAKPLALPKLASKGEQKRRTGKVLLSQAETTRLVNAAHQQGVTLNDLFMAAFGRAVQRFSLTDRIALACPVDMRKFISGKPQLRIANHTSRYNFNIHSDISAPFAAAVKDVHLAMSKNKANFQCLTSVKSLVERYQNSDLAQLQQSAEDNYHVRNIAYTNFGLIDGGRFQFNGCRISDFDMLGSYRRMPMFQVAESTFNGQIIFACAMIANTEEARLGQAVMLMMKDMLNNYSLQFAE